ncbi:unnamed protein product, partial [Prorocentrum cordatum]
DSNRILDQGKASTCPPPHEAHPKGRGAGSARRRARRRARETPRSSPRCCARNWGPTSNRGRKKSVPPRRRAAPRRARRLAAAATAPPQRRAPRTRARGAGAAARSRSAGAPPHRMGPAASAQGASGRGTLFPDHGLYSGLHTHTHTPHTHTRTHFFRVEATRAVARRGQAGEEARAAGSQSRCVGAREPPRRPGKSTGSLVG